MYCKKCDKKYESNVSICPICETNLKLKKTLKIIYLIIPITILLYVLTSSCVNNIRKNNKIEYLKTKNASVEKINNNEYITLAQNTFKLPTDFLYSQKENYLDAISKDTSIAYKMNIVNVDYSAMINNLKKIIESIVSSGTQVVSSYVATYEDREYLILATIQNNQNYLYAITQFSSTMCVQILVDSTTYNGYEIAILNVNKIINQNIKINFDLNIPLKTSLDDFLSTNSSKLNLEELFKVS